MISENCIPGRQKVCFVYTLFEEPCYLLSESRLQKSKSLRRESTPSSPAVQKRAASKKKSGKGGGQRLGKEDDCESGSHRRLQLLKFLFSSSYRMKLPLGSHRQHSTQTMAWLAHYCTFCIHLRIPVFSTMCKALLFTGAVLKAQV